MAILLGGLFVAYNQGVLRRCCNWRQTLSFTGMGTREFNRPDRPDEVSSAGGELEMQQPAQSPTLPGQPAHVMQVQQLPPPQTVAQQPRPAVQQESVEPNEWL